MQLYALKLSQALSFECIEYICTLCGIHIDSTGTKNKNTYKKQLIPLIENYIVDTLKVHPTWFEAFFFKTQNKKVYYVPTLPTVNKSYPDYEILGINQIRTKIQNKSITLKYKPNLKVPSQDVADLCNKIIKTPEAYTHFEMNFTDSDDDYEYDPAYETAMSQAHVESDWSQYDSANHNPEYDYPEHAVDVEHKPDGIFYPSGNDDAFHDDNNLQLNTTTTNKIPLVDYESEEKNGDIMDWYNGNLFILTLHGDSLTEPKQIAMILSAMKGDIQRQVSAELQSKDSPASLTLADFQTALTKITKRTKTEYSRLLDHLQFQGGDVKDFYGKILNLVKKLLGSGKTDSHKSLASTYLKAKCLKNNLSFQLSEKLGRELVDLAQEILNITKTPVVSHTNAYYADKNPQNCSYCHKSNHSYQFCRTRLSDNRPPSQYGYNNSFETNYPPWQQQYFPNSQQYFPKPKVCHFCTKIGHIARACHSRARGDDPHPKSVYAELRDTVSNNNLHHSETIC